MICSLPLPWHTQPCIFFNYPYPPDLILSALPVSSIPSPLAITICVNYPPSLRISFASITPDLLFFISLRHTLLHFRSTNPLPRWYNSFSSDLSKEKLCIRHPYCVFLPQLPLPSWSFSLPLLWHTQPCIVLRQLPLSPRLDFVYPHRFLLRLYIHRTPYYFASATPPPPPHFIFATFRTPDFPNPLSS